MSDLRYLLPAALQHEREVEAGRSKFKVSTIFHIAKRLKAAAEDIEEDHYQKIYNEVMEER